MSPQTVVRVLTLSASLLFVENGFTQASSGPPSRPPGGAPTTGTGNINTTTLPSTTNTNSTTNTTNKGPGYTPPIFLSGRVALEDGSPPPESATIERVCGSSARAEGYTDSHGNFGIQLGNESSVFQDASETTGRSSMPGVQSPNGSSNGASSGGPGSSSMGGSYNRYQNCELRAKLPGYRSQSISLANRQPLDDPNLGTILLHKETGETGTVVSAGTLGAPKDARKAYERGLQALKKNKMDEAGKEFEKTVQLYPQHAEAWLELGRIQLDRGQTEVARQSFNQSIQADPKYVNPHVQLCLIALKAKQWKELASLSDRGMRLDSFDFPQLFLFNAVANYNLHKFDVAERSIKQAVRLDTQHHFPDILRLNGLLLILHKDYDGAADQFRQYLKAAPDSDDAAKVRADLNEVEQAGTRSAKQ